MRALLAIPLLFALGCASTPQAKKPVQAQNAPLDFMEDSPCACGDGGDCSCAMDGSGCACKHD